MSATYFLPDQAVMASIQARHPLAHCLASVPESSLQDNAQPNHWYKSQLLSLWLPPTPSLNRVHSWHDPSPLLQMLSVLCLVWSMFSMVDGHGHYKQTNCINRTLIV